ncbi:MAG: glycosyltransferase, partial [Ilumatobacteraceae bacterium]
MVLPTYNEAENIDRLLRELRSIVPEARLLVVDDGSPDGTGRLA